MDNNNLSGRNLENLSGEEIKQLASESASKLDIIQVRKTLHDQIGKVSTILNRLEKDFSDHDEAEWKWKKRIEDALYVTVKNGTPRKVSIGELIMEHHELLKQNQKDITLFSSVKIKDLDGEMKSVDRAVFDQMLLNLHNPKLKAKKILEWWDIIRAFIGIAQITGITYIIYKLIQ